MAFHPYCIDSLPLTTSAFIPFPPYPVSPPASPAVSPEKHSLSKPRCLMLVSVSASREPDLRLSLPFSGQRRPPVSPLRTPENIPLRTSLLALDGWEGLTEEVLWVTLGAASTLHPHSTGFLRNPRKTDMSGNLCDHGLF